MLLTLFALALAMFTVAVPDAGVGWQSLGDPESTVALKQVDAVALSRGLNERFHRQVCWVSGVRSEAIPGTGPSGDFAVVNYVRIGSEPELATGLQIWIDRKSRETVIVPNKLVRAAQLVALQAGHDLTHYSWILE